MQELNCAQGTVVDIHSDIAVVEVLQTEACEGCGMQRACGIHKGKKLNVNARIPQQLSVNIGQTVCLESAPKAHFKATFLAYLLPSLLILLVLYLGVELLNWSEGVAALAALGIIMIYFIVLHIFNRRLISHFEFHIKQV